MKEEPNILGRIKRIHHKVFHKGNKVLKEEELTLVQGHVLMFLFHQKDFAASMKTLERELVIAQSSTAGLVARLEKKGLLILLPDPADKRAKVVKLTKKAEIFGEDLHNTICQIETDMLSSFTPIEKLVFLQLLEKLESSLEDI